MNSGSFLISAGLILLLDLGVTAARTGLINTRITRLINLPDTENIKIDKTVALLSPHMQLLIRLRVSQALLRFVFLGLVFWEFAGDIQPNFPLVTIGIIVLVTTLLVALAEYLVEVYILQEPERWAIKLTTFIKSVFLILTPVLIIPVIVSRIFAKEPDRSLGVTQDELISMLDISQEEGGLEQEERQMIKSIFQLRDTFAREIMVPRIDILALNVNTDIMDAIEQMLESGYSRVPVYEESIDRVIGILYVKDLLRLCRDKMFSGNLQGHTRPAYFIPETKHVDDLLTEMQQERIHIAVVVDEYGGVSGMVTLEDIVEELVGEIQDEYDKIEEQVYQQIGKDEYVFQGGINLDDFNEIMNTELPQDDADTLGGLIYSQIGRIPKGGEVIRKDNLQLTVEQVTGRRIRKVKVQRISSTGVINQDQTYVDR